MTTKIPSDTRTDASELVVGDTPQADCLRACETGTNLKQNRTLHRRSGIGSALACGCVSRAIFVPDGEWLIPQPNACGPWFPGVQHGGSIAGLFARAIERVASDTAMFTTRISIDMSRRVPMAPTKVETEVVRNGRRVQAIEARYVVSDEVVARATATRIRVDEGLSSNKIGVGFRPEDLPPMQPEEVPDMEDLFVGFDFVRNFVMRREQTPSGQAMTWARLDRQFVAGEPNTPLIQLAAVADMIPSANSLLDYGEYLSVNPDLNIAVSRLPNSDWVGSLAVVRNAPGGVGQTDAQLFDEQGVIGRSIKSLLIDHRK